MPPSSSHFGELFGLGFLQPPHQPLKHRQRLVGGVGVTGAQHRGQGKTIAAIENEEWVIHVLFVIAVEEAELLFPGVGSSVASMSRTITYRGPGWVLSYNFTNQSERRRRSLALTRF